MNIPSVNPSSNKLPNRPRNLLLDISPTYNGHTLVANPTPYPRIARAIQSTQKTGETIEKIAPPNDTALNIMTDFFRPILSAIMPVADPTKAPTNMLVVKTPCNSVSSSYSIDIEPKVNAITPVLYPNINPPKRLTDTRNIISRFCIVTTVAYIPFYTTVPWFLKLIRGNCVSSLKQINSISPQP